MKYDNSDIEIAVCESEVAIAISSERFVISNKKRLNFDEAKRLAETQCAELPSFEKALIIHEHLEEINNVLEKNGIDKIKGHLWIGRPVFKSETSVPVFGIETGTVLLTSPNDTNWALLIENI